MGIIFKFLFFLNLANEKVTRASCKAEKLKTLVASVFLYMLAFAIQHLFRYSQLDIEVGVAGS